MHLSSVGCHITTPGHIANPVMRLDRDWEFRRGSPVRGWKEGANVTDVEKVDLPHCWNEKEEFQEGVAYYRGPGAYRMAFKPDASLVPDRAGAWLLESEGFYGTGEVWLNNSKIADVDGEYLGFSLDVSGKLNPSGENLLAVVLTNRCDSHVLPGIAMPDFLLYGGLTGRVALRHAPETRLEKNSCLVTYGSVFDPAVSVRVLCEAYNGSSGVRRLKMRWRVMDLSGAELASAESGEFQLGAGMRGGPGTTELSIPRPRLWCPDDPHLYIIACDLVEGGAVIDGLSVRTGFRSCEFTAGRGFFLNGQKVELKGCNRHESMPGFGRALPDSIHREDAALLRETGCNLVRLSHYPQHPAFLDACDELGLMVYSEIATWKSVTIGKWLRSARRQMERLVRRDRNRPSVILWGMGNESRSLRAYQELGQVIREFDPSRPTIYAENHYKRARKEGTIGLPDVWGCNYEFDTLEEGRQAAKLGVTLVTECSNLPTTQRGNLVEELRQCAIIAADWQRMEGLDYNAGHIIWCFNDYSTLRKERYMRYSGIFDAWRLPKLSRAMLQAAYLREPFVRAHVDWGKDNPNRIRQLFVFTNCEHIEVLRNGKIIQESDALRQIAWSVFFEPGELEIRGTREGKSVSHRIRSHGPAVRLEIQAERNSLPAAARETTGVRIKAVDENGEACSNWNGTARITVAGAARQRNFNPGNLIPVAWGEGRAFITGSGQVGTACITAESAPLASATCEVAFLLKTIDRELRHS